MIRGSHTVKFARPVCAQTGSTVFSAFPTSGSYDFNGQHTRQTGTTGAQTALADFALGVPDAVSRNVLVGTFGMRIWSPLRIRRRLLAHHQPVDLELRPALRALCASLRSARPTVETST